MNREQAFKRVEELRKLLPNNGYEVVDLMESSHTQAAARASGSALDRYGIRNARQVRLYDFLVVHPAPDFKTPLTTIEQAKAWIEALEKAGLMFHFEDSPETIIYMVTHEPIFSPEEAKDVRERVRELYSMDWSVVGHECPIGYALEVIGHVIEE